MFCSEAITHFKKVLGSGNIFGSYLSRPALLLILHNGKVLGGTVVQVQAQERQTEAPQNSCRSRHRLSDRVWQPLQRSWSAASRLCPWWHVYLPTVPAFGRCQRLQHLCSPFQILDKKDFAVNIPAVEVVQGVCRYTAVERERAVGHTLRELLQDITFADTRFCQTQNRKGIGRLVRRQRQEQDKGITVFTQNADGVQLLCQTARQVLFRKKMYCPAFVFLARRKSLLRDFARVTQLLQAVFLQLQGKGGKAAAGFEEFQPPFVTKGSLKALSVWLSLYKSNVVRCGG